MKYYDGEKEYQSPENLTWRFECYMRRQKKRGVLWMHVSTKDAHLSVFKSEEKRNAIQGFIEKGEKIAKELINIFNQDKNGETRPYHDY